MTMNRQKNFKGDVTLNISGKNIVLKTVSLLAEQRDKKEPFLEILRKI